jgi:hypothetical protein
MTFDELKAQLATDCPFWGESEWNAFLTADPATQQALATAMHLSTEGLGVNGWQTALTILQEAAPAFSLIPAVGPFITSGIEAIDMLVNYLRLKAEAL